MSAFEEAVKNVFEKNGMPLTGMQAALFESFFALIAQKNRVMNLTRITEPEEAALKHFFDSVSVLKYIAFKNAASVLDVGTGAGFPGIPLQIMRPDLRLTLIDSSAKKTAFVQESLYTLGLNAACIAGRAEDIARSGMRESFDYVLSRAVAPLNVLLELCMPFVKNGGLFIAYKGADHAEETTLAAGAIKSLEAELQHVFLPYAERSHALIVFEKRSSTDGKFPRKYAQIKSRPL